MFSEFGPGGEGVTKEKFSSVMRDILLGLGDGLEREPVAISPLDGSTLEKWVRGPEFDMEAAAAFSELDSDTSGQVKADAIRKALGRLTVDQGMPPQTDASVTCLALLILQSLDLPKFPEVFFQRNERYRMEVVKCCNRI